MRTMARSLYHEEGQCQRVQQEPRRLEYKLGLSMASNEDMLAARSSIAWVHEDHVDNDEHQHRNESYVPKQ